MQKIILIVGLIIFLIPNYAMSEVMEGGVSKIGEMSGNQVVDRNTNKPVADAAVTLPMLQYKTYTDENGMFHLGTKINGETVMSVEKEGYRPFSLTVDEKSASAPIIVGIQKSNADDIHLETQMMHLGDNNYSRNSANSDEFKVSALGPFYTKTFKMATSALTKTHFLVIGSIIGIDTAIARSMGQNRIRNSYSSPPEVFFNGHKIAEIQLNGDGQRIKIPTNLIRQNQNNQITIKTGKNLMQTAYTDYDDIEIMNLSIISE